MNRVVSVRPGCPVVGAHYWTRSRRRLLCLHPGPDPISRMPFARHLVSPLSDPRGTMRRWPTSTRRPATRSTKSWTGTGAARSTGWVHVANSSLVIPWSTSSNVTAGGWCGLSVPNHTSGRRGQPASRETRARRASRSQVDGGGVVNR